MWGSPTQAGAASSKVEDLPQKGSEEPGANGEGGLKGRVRSLALGWRVRCPASAGSAPTDHDPAGSSLPRERGGPCQVVGSPGGSCSFVLPCSSLILTVLSQVGWGGVGWVPPWRVPPAHAPPSQQPEQLHKLMPLLPKPWLAPFTREEPECLKVPRLLLLRLPQAPWGPLCCSFSLQAGSNAASSEHLPCGITTSPAAPGADQTASDRAALSSGVQATCSGPGAPPRGEQAGFPAAQLVQCWGPRASDPLLPAHPGSHHPLCI